jgi:hypothetical protein
VDEAGGVKNTHRAGRTEKAKNINQAWGSNPESRPIAYSIGKSRLTIGPTRLIVVQLLTSTRSRPSSLDHPHKGAKMKGGRPAYHWANPADCCSAPHIHTKSTKLPRPPSQGCQNLARLRRALFLFPPASTPFIRLLAGGEGAGSSWSKSSSSSVSGSSTASPFTGSGRQGEPGTKLIVVHLPTIRTTPSAVMRGCDAVVMSLAGKVTVILLRSAVKGR